MADLQPDLFTAGQLSPSPSPPTVVAMASSGGGIAAWIWENKRTIGLVGFVVILVFFAGYIYFKLKRDHAQEVVKAKQKAYKRANAEAEKKLAKLIARQAQARPNPRAAPRQQPPRTAPPPPPPVVAPHLQQHVEADHELQLRHQAYLAQLRQQQQSAATVDEKTQPTAAEAGQPEGNTLQQPRPLFQAHQQTPTPTSSSSLPSSPESAGELDQQALLQAMAALAAHDPDYAAAMMAQISNSPPPDEPARLSLSELVDANDDDENMSPRLSLIPSSDDNQDQEDD